MFILNSEIRKLLYKTTLFVIIISIPVGYCEYVLSKNAALNGEYASYIYRYRELFENSTKSDVLILGSSSACHGIVPSLIKLQDHSVYNFAFNGATTTFNYDLFNSLLIKHYNKPKLIIYSVNSFMFDSKRLWRRIEQDYKYMPWTKKLIFSEYTPILWKRLYITHEDNIYSAIYNNKANKSIVLDTYNNGFIAYEKEYTKRANPIETRIDKDEIDSFINHIKLIKQMGIQLIFIDIPVYSPDIFVDNISIEKSNKELIEKIAIKNDIVFLDYNKDLKSSINLDRTCFSDWVHLNNIGANKFSSKLSIDINKLIKLGRIVIDRAQFVP